MTSGTSLQKQLKLDMLKTGKEATLRDDNYKTWKLLAVGQMLMLLIFHFPAVPL